MTHSNDELKRLYEETHAMDERRPASHVRAAVLAHAQMVLDAKAATQSQPVPPRTPVAANLPAWKAALVASVLLVPLIGILVSRDPEHVSGGDQVAVVSIPAPAPTTVAAPSGQTARPQAESAMGVNAGANANANANANVVAGSGSRADAGRAQAAIQAQRSSTEVSVARAGTQMGSDVTLATATATATASGESLPEQSRRSDAAVAYAPPARALTTAPAAPVAAQAPAPAQTAVAGAGALARTSPAALDAAQSSSAKRARTVGATPADAFDVKASFFQAVAEGNISAMEGFVVRGASVDARDSAGRTALIVAVLAGQEVMVARLLALGGAPGLLDKEGLTALQHAQHMGHARIVSLLERRD